MPMRRNTRYGGAAGSMDRKRARQLDVNLTPSEAEVEQAITEGRNKAAALRHFETWIDAAAAGSGWGEKHHFMCRDKRNRTLLVSAGDEDRIFYIDLEEEPRSS